MHSVTCLPVKVVLNFFKPRENRDRTVQTRKFFLGNWTKPTVFYGTATYNTQSAIMLFLHVKQYYMNISSLQGPQCLKSYTETGSLFRVD